MPLEFAWCPYLNRDISLKILQNFKLWLAHCSNHDFNNEGVSKKVNEKGNKVRENILCSQERVLTDKEKNNVIEAMCLHCKKVVWQRIC